MNWYLAVLKNYAGFSGRARRLEYWMFQLFNFIIAVVLSIVDALVFGTNENSIGILSTMYNLLVFIPSLAVSARRLHDINRSAWWLLLLLIPVIGWLVLIVFHIMDGTHGDNRFGPSPKAV